MRKLALATLLLILFSHVAWAVDWRYKSATRVGRYVEIMLEDADNPANTEMLRFGATEEVAVVKAAIQRYIIILNQRDARVDVTGTYR